MPSGLFERWRRGRSGGRRTTLIAEAAPVEAPDPDQFPEQVYHDAALAFLSTQISASDALDSKASQALTVGSAALPLTIALVNVARSAGVGFTSLTLDVVPQVLFVLALVFYLSILVLNLRLGQVSRLEYRPDMMELRQTFLAERRHPLAGRSLQRWVADAYVDSTVANRNLLQRKIRLVSVIQIALALEGAALTIGAAWALLV
ncbi:MAG TPA: hypothetical protein VGT61_01000 [Thermomicrobiales bacterium]|nr:hypothetical protein [Thermomicrobiales bacterium]